MSYKNTLFALFLVFIPLISFSQQLPLAADKIIAVVGNRYVILSEVNGYFMNEKLKNDTIPETEKCNILFDMVAQKVLADQAFRDSLLVTDAQVESELQDRIESYIVEFGSKEAMETRLGKSVFQIKEENREEIKEQLMAQQLRGQLAQKVVITPEEVKAYYDKIAEDDLPYINATVEVGQIIYNPIPSKEIEEYTRRQLNDLREDIVKNNKDFGTVAGIYSQDPGTRNEGGYMVAKKNALDPIFAGNIFRLNEGEISPVFRSSYGYHIVKMEKRMGDEAAFRHILLIPEVTSSDLQLAIQKMDSLKREIDAGKIDFNKAVESVSNDDISKSRGGMMFDLNNGQTKMSLDALDPQSAKTLGNMKVGDYSEPEIFQNVYKSGARGVRILYLKDRIDPHKANFKDDYTLFYNFAKTEKQKLYVIDKVYEFANTMYVHIDEQYHSCPTIKPFVKNTASN